MRLHAIAKRLDVIERQAPPQERRLTPNPALLTDAEIDELNAFTLRIRAAGDAYDPCVTFTPAERERISEILFKAEAVS